MYKVGHLLSLTRLLPVKLHQSGSHFIALLTFPIAVATTIVILGAHTEGDSVIKYLTPANATEDINIGWQRIHICARLVGDLERGKGKEGLHRTEVSTLAKCIHHVFPFVVCLKVDI